MPITCTSTRCVAVRDGACAADAISAVEEQIALLVGSIVIAGDLGSFMSAPALWNPYCGPAPLPADWLGRWNLDPLLLLALFAAAGLGLHLLQGTPPGRRGAFAAALILLAILFVSPFCALTSALFSARVVHHVALTAVAAPLIAAALSHAPRLGSLAAATALHALVFWAWHAPPLYAAALSNDLLYWLMQASLLGSALVLWLAVRRAPALAAAAALLATMVQMGLLGALLTFVDTALYAPHFASTYAWGFTPLEDQQLAGLIMWAPAAGLYLAAALLIVGRWLSRQARPAAA